MNLNKKLFGGFIVESWRVETLQVIIEDTLSLGFSPFLEVVGVWFKSKDYYYFSKPHIN